MYRKAGENLKGMSMGTVLALLGACSAFLFAIAAAGIFSLRMEGAVGSKEQARHLAESAVHMGLAKLLEDESFGLDRTPAATLTVPTDGYPAGSWGLLTFDPDTAGSKMRYSTNNIAVSTSVSGDQRVVPGNTVHLVGKGFCGGEVYQVECLFHRPPFPKGVASNGSIAAEGLTLLGLTEDSEFSGALSNLPEEERRPAHLFANSSKPNGVVLGVGSNIYGNVGSVGGVSVQSGAVVMGEVRPGSLAQDCPDLDIGQLISKVESYTGGSTIGGAVPTLELDWFRSAGGPLTIEGDLVLDNGVLTVRGDLRIAGSVSGYGAILVDGSVRVENGGSLDGVDNIAVAATGDIQLIGGGRSSYFFNGLLYSEQKIEVRDLTLLGTVVSNGPTDQQGMTLDNVNLIQRDVSTQFGVGVPFHHDDGDDGFMFWVQMIPGPDGETRYNLTALYTISSPSPTDPNDGGWETRVSFPGLTEDQVASQLVAFVADQDGNEELPVIASTTVADYLDALKGDATSEYVLSLSLNRVLTPIETSRILLWRRLE